MNVTGIYSDDLPKMNIDLLNYDDQRVYLNQDGVSAFASRSAIVTRLVNARDKAKLDAIKNLARYKFSNFGYHAARWVTLNTIIGDRQANPFRELIECAKQISKKDSDQY